MKILIDFDNTIHDPPEDDKEGEANGKPMPGSIEALQALHDEGHDLVIFTARRDLIPVYNWLTTHVFETVDRFPLPVTNKKEYADLYIDDAAIHFDGDWSEIIKEVNLYGDSSEDSSA